MRQRLFTFLGVLCLAALPSPARPADAEDAKSPTLVVRIKSIDDLIADGKYIARLAGQAEKVEQGEGLLHSFVDGIDSKRPLGLYGFITPDLQGSNGVVLVPVSDAKALRDTLERFQIKLEKGEDDVYSVSSDAMPIPVPIYARFANDYLYVTAQKKDALAKDHLLDPEKALAGARKATLSARFRLDQLPDGLKQIALGTMELKMAEEKEKKIPNETKAQHDLRVKVIDNSRDHLAGLIKEGGDLSFVLDVDRKANQLLVEVTFNGKPGSALAKHIAGIQEAQSLFRGLLSDDAALNVAFHFILPEDAREALDPVIDEGIRQGMEKEKDKEKRERAEKILKVVLPTLKAGELDMAVSLRGPTDDDHYTLVAGIKVKDGADVQAAIQNLVQELPEKERDRIKLDVETVDGIKVHRIDAQKDFDEDHRRTLGDNPFYLAVREDAVLVAGGANGLSALKEALGSTKAKATPPLLVEVSMAHLAPLMAHGDEKATAELHKLVESVFKGDKGTDKIKVTLEGGENLTFRATIAGPVIRFAARMDKNPDIKKATQRHGKKKAKKADDDDDD
jgi:hypothetical protein